MLLDTHIFLWWLFNDAKLPQNIKLFVQDRNNQVFVSAVSAWEITTKFRLGKLPEAALVAKDVPLWIIKAGFEPLPETPVHAQLAGEWDFSHRDPFDRLLIAEAIKNNLTILTKDQIIPKYGVSILW